MKVVRYGHVIITPKEIRVEGWLMAKEESDPPEATAEQLVTAFAAEWALKKLAGAVQKESIAALERAGQRMKAEQAKAN